MDDRTPPADDSGDAVDSGDNEPTPASERPFRVVVEPHAAALPDDSPVDDEFDPFGADGLGAADIEEAYRRAFEAMDRAWQEAEPILGPAQSREFAPASEAVAEAITPASYRGRDESAGLLRLDSARPASGELGETAGSIPAPKPHLLTAGTPAPPTVPDAPAEVTVLRALEALLFVGGVTLTPQRISAVLGLTGESRSVSDLVDELNQRFAVDGRPYEVQFSQGGYHLELRPEYERLRRKVYGIGPREVKLTQESLEILALVAYRQPLTGDELERCGKGQAAGLLRQLIRRDLVSVERFTTEEGTKDVRYTTTPRFLDLFGLGNLKDLPQPEDLATK